MRALAMSAVAGIFMAGAASSEPFQEVVVGVPVASIGDAEAWYQDLFGPDVEIIRPVPGVVEFKVAPGVWFQIFETEGKQVSGTIVRFQVDDIHKTQRDGAELGINMGEVIVVPNVVTYSEFADPDENALGLYDLP